MPERLPSSFRDPSGFLFTRDNTLYRQVNVGYREHYDQLISSGLYRDLVDRGDLIPHEEASAASSDAAAAYRILRPEKVPFISYPYEWSFSQLQDAALATLRIQKRALESDMTLKDASAYNIQFRNGKPVCIDTLSFERYHEGRPWVAYRQFCQHFLAPLALMSHTDIRLHRLLKDYIDGIPLDLARALLAWRSRWRPSLLFHISLHAHAQSRFAGSRIDRKEVSAGFSRRAMMGLIDGLMNAVNGLKLNLRSTEWSHYYEQTNYSESALDHKKSLVSELVREAGSGQVWDLGANTGLFSRVVAAQGRQTIAFDLDPLAVELNYRQCVKDRESRLLPLVLDLTNPSPALGWANRERDSLMERGPAGAVLALALVHHLAIANNVPLSSVAEFFATLSPWLIIEFVPKSDGQVQRLLASREDIFADYTRDGFEAAFSSLFEIERAIPVQESERVIYLMRRR